MPIGFEGKSYLGAEAGLASILTYGALIYLFDFLVPK